MSAIAFSWPDSRRLIRFVAVGGVATLVHWGAAIAAGRLAGIAPLPADVLGWVLSFGVSFAGQCGITFRDQGAPVARAARRFFLVSLGGFTTNLLLYSALLRLSPWPHEWLLAIVLGGVALLSYVLSRRWAFQGGR
jgi:putative flippase GtrA